MNDLNIFQILIKSTREEHMYIVYLTEKLNNKNYYCTGTFVSRVIKSHAKKSQ